jgi:conjugative transfer signal peptidase TraF
MTSPIPLIALAVAGCLLVAAPVGAPSSKRLVFNTTNSAPLGFYWLGDDEPRPGDLALVQPPRRLAAWMAKRGYLPSNVPLIKRVAAVEGHLVCIRSGVVSIDGSPVGALLQKDRVGRALPVSGLCRRLKADEVFFLNGEPRSLDSRYFGPLSRRCVVGRLTPLWTWVR